MHVCVCVCACRHHKKVKLQGPPGAGRLWEAQACSLLCTCTGWRMSIQRTSSWRHLPSSCEMSVSAKQALHGGHQTGQTIAGCLKRACSAACPYSLPTAVKEVA